MSKALKLRLNDKEYLEFLSNLKPKSLKGMPIDELGLYLNIKIVFCSGRQKHILSYNWISWDVLWTTIVALRKAVNNHFSLDFVVDRDIGYMHNENLNLPIDQWDFGAWQGKKFLVWSAPGVENYLETWIYNDMLGNIIMCVTECYGWEGLDKSFGKNYITYNQFIKNYKEPLVRIIPHQVARQWLAQCEYLLAILKENERSGSCRKTILAAHGIYE